MEAVKQVRSRTVVLPYDDIDTDQIIPARFLTTTTAQGLGEHLFADWRRDASGQTRSDFALNQPAAQGAAILVAGRNFGCGSSREHAPWALLDFGIRVVIVDERTHAWLLSHPGVELLVDIEKARLTLPDGTTVPFPIDGFSRHCLIKGVDQLGFLLDHAEDIRRFEDARA
jgi:3-isopropylmalate/(R)-2-methylmalate dehydratase small subunit